MITFGISAIVAILFVISFELNVIRRTLEDIRSILNDVNGGIYHIGKDINDNIYRIGRE